MMQQSDTHVRCLLRMCDSTYNSYGIEDSVEWESQSLPPVSLLANAAPSP